MEEDKDITFTREDLVLAIRLAYMSSYDVGVYKDWIENIVQQVIKNKNNN
jgi:hypothetical protein